MQKIQGNVRIEIQVFINYTKYIFLQMQGAGDQQYLELKTKFGQIDNNHNGYITKEQLQKFMQKQKLFSTQAWKLNEAMQILNQKMNEDDFIIWIMGCKTGMEDFANAKYRFHNNIKNLNSAGPSPNPGVKKSYLNVSVNREEQSIISPSSHYFNLKVGVDKEADSKKRKQIASVLGKNPAEVYFVLKFRAIAEGQKIAQKLNELLKMAVDLGSELGPTATPFIESLTFTTKWVNDYIYVIIQLNNSFVNVLVKFLNEAMQQLTPEGKFLLDARISSNFTKVLHNNFDPLSQQLGFDASLQLGGIALSKLKEKLLEGFEKQNFEDQMNMIMLFLLEEVNLAVSFSNLKDCFASFGLNEKDIPKPGAMAGQLKQYEVKSLIAQFIPDSEEILEIISEYCKPEGQISLNVSDLTAQLSFNFTVQGAFDLL